MGDEVMGVWELLEGWEWRRLGEQDVAEIIMGQSPPGKTYNDKGEGLPFFQGKADFGVLYPSPHKWCTAPNKVAEPGDVLISVRAPVGPTNLCAETCCIGRGLAAIRPGPRADSKFLLFALRAMESEITQRGQGSTFAAITKRDLVDLQIPLPPLTEQRRIVARIEELFARIEEARRLRAAADQDAERLMPAALDSAWREMSRVEGVTTPLGELISDTRNGLYKPKRFYGQGTLFIRMYNIEDRHLTFEDTARVEADQTEIAKFRLSEGDILFNRVNSPELVGKSAVVSSLPETAVYEAMLIRVRVDKTKLNPEFAVAMLNAPACLGDLRSRAKKAIAQASLNQQDLRETALPVPPLPEQRRIVTYLDGVQAQVAELKHLQTESAAELERLSGAVLVRASQGEL